MVLSTSQQVALAFTAVLFTFVVLPRLFGVGGGTAAKETKSDLRYNRKGPGPGASRGQPINVSPPGSHQSADNIQQMKKRLEQEMKSDKYKSNNNKGYVFTLMPLYAIGVGVFAAYKFLKIKSSDNKTQKDKFAKGAKKSAEAENQLNELEQRLAQTERMLNSILTQLDPLTNCVKSVAQEQKNEIMSQLQTIRYLMKKRGMDCPPLSANGGLAERALGFCGVSTRRITHTNLCVLKSERWISAEEEEEEKEEEEAEADDKGEDKVEDSECSSSCETNNEQVCSEQPGTGLRRRNRPE
uniref:Resistance to inhibitors of cholinesterase protein 3 N-terminal domain-containing protein n=1 Tax=Poecilia mexicana TaxID=48701 RepID=A0A3B3WPX5_9TELE